MSTDESMGTLIRLRTKVREDTVETQMEAIGRIPGTIVVYRDGKDIISLHKDHNPASPDNKRALRVNAIISPRNQD